MKGKIKSLSRDRVGTWLITLETEDRLIRDKYDELKGKDIDIKLCRYREKRSVDANSYCWTLINQIAAVLNQRPNDIYRHCIREIGGNYQISPILNKDLARWREIWESKGTGWICEDMGESKLDGYTNTRNYYGSSKYDSRQMSQLIDRVVDEARELGIETMTPNEIARVKALWTA